MRAIGQVVSMVRREGITDVVLGVTKVPPRRRWILPAALAASVHIGLAVLLPYDDSGERWVLGTAQRIRTLMAAYDARPIELPAPPPEPPRAEPTPPPETARPLRTTTKRPASASQAPAQGPAQAGRIVASVPTANEPVDLTAAFVIGDGAVYAGGTTTAQGRSKTKVEGPVASTPSAPVPRPTTQEPDRSRDIALADPDWTCPWPPEAADIPIDEQVAVVRVEVSAGGRCESTSVVRDPGHGFGAQAADCARRASFLPALDPRGTPIRSTAAIRVRFVR